MDQDSNGQGNNKLKKMMGSDGSNNNGGQGGYVPSPFGQPGQQQSEQQNNQQQYGQYQQQNFQQTPQYQQQEQQKQQQFQQGFGNNYSDNLITGGESYFDGTVLQLFVQMLLCSAIVIITGGIGAPWAIVRFLSWQTSCTVVSGERLAFTGTAMQLFILYLKMIGIFLLAGFIIGAAVSLLGEVVAIIVGLISIPATFYVQFKIAIIMMQWKAENTVFEDFA